GSQDAARSRLGSGVRRTVRISAGVRRTAAKKIGDRPRESALPAHRTMGRVPVQSDGIARVAAVLRPSPTLAKDCQGRRSKVQGPRGDRATLTALRPQFLAT